MSWLLWTLPQKENLGLAVQLCQVHELEEEEYYHPSADRVTILPMRVSKMYWTFGKSNSVAALMETVFCKVALEDQAVVPNLFHITSIYEACVTFVFPRLGFLQNTKPKHVDV